MTKSTEGSRASRHRWVTAFAGAMWCLIAACALNPAESTVNDMLATDEQSIIGGQLDRTSWCVAKLLIHDPGVSTGIVCTCSFIDTNTCLTAAHCVDPRVIGTGKVFEVHTETNAPLSVLVGTSTSFDPEWDPSNVNGGHDFGIVRTNAPGPFVCDRSSLSPSLPVHFIGYGSNAHNNTGAGTRRRVITPIVSSNSVLIQAGNANAGGCHGDSGGPAIQWINRWTPHHWTWPVVVGVISFGTDQPPQVCVGSTFAARVDSATAWIDQQVPCGNGSCEPGFGESTSSCPLDCHVCGDGACAWGPEDDINCFGDCHCGNGVCDGDEASWTCWMDCPDNCSNDDPSLLCLSDPS